MGFTKVRMGKEEIFETQVKDMDGRLLEKWLVMKRDFGRVVKILNKKYGLSLIVKDRKKDKDLDWAI